MIVNVNHVSFTVSDLDKSVDFYKDILGFKLLDVSDRDQDFSEKVTGIKGAKLRIAYLFAGNCSIELIQYISPAGKKLDTLACNVGSSHVCFYADKFKEFVNKLNEKGIKFVNEPQIIPAGPNKGRYVVFIEDSDSNSLEFISTERY